MQPQADPFIVPKCEASIEVIYQDDNLLVINKPTKLLSLSGKHPLNKDSVHFRLAQDFPTCTLIHRLDFGTSGLMVLALNKVSNRQLCQQFSDRTVVKHYEAVLDGEVNGTMDNKAGEINIPIIKDLDAFPLQKVCYDSGKVAISPYVVLSTNTEDNTSLVRFMPSTGRTHQLRIHSREIGHPIIGCDLYDLHDSYFKADRLMLHASYLQFCHPETKALMKFHLPSHWH